MQRKHVHLEMIQGVVNRLSNNSFLLKGWSVVIVSGLFALYAANNKLLFVYLAFLPSIAFWLLDGYFLRQERLFRLLYDRVRMLPDDKIDYAMKVSHLKKNIPQTYRLMFTRTLLVFHGAVLLAIATIAGISVLGLGQNGSTAAAKNSIDLQPLSTQH